MNGCLFSFSTKSRFLERIVDFFSPLKAKLDRNDDEYFLYTVLTITTSGILFYFQFQTRFGIF